MRFKKYMIGCTIAMSCIFPLTSVAAEDVEELTLDIPIEEMPENDEDANSVSDCEVLYNLNNYVKQIDFKLNAEQLEQNHAGYFGESAYVEASDLQPEQNLSGLSVEESWLISNNIISRPGALDYDSLEFSPIQLDTETQFTASELWMALAKIGGGVQPSRLFLYEDNSIDVSDVASSGNAWLSYQSPNVYELYFTTLLDQGILQESEFTTKKGKTFIADYKQLATMKSSKTTVPWINTKGACLDGKANMFGYSTKHDASSKKIVEKTPAYFATENLYTVDALKIVERWVRANEKDMSELEASIVSYKYGLHVLNSLPEDDMKAVQFLIAKGILNFEDADEVINIYGKLTRELAYKILYRVANVDARYDFSAITLTDSATAWQAKGFYENKVEVYSADSVPTAKTLTSAEYESLLKNASGYKMQKIGTTEEETDPDFIDDLLSSVKNVFKQTAVAEVSGNYKVTKMFDNQYSYTYGGKAISSLKTGEEIVEINTLDFANTGKEVTVITFSVSAKNADNALKYVDNKISCGMGTLLQDTIEGYTKIENDSGEVITLVSASSITSLFKDITILEDKLLLNSKTNTEAIILPEAGYALVGNQCIISDTLMETISDGQVYYNLEIIASLLNNAVLEKTINEAMYVCKDLGSDTYVKVESYSGSELGHAYVTNLVNKKFNTKKASKKFVNISQMTNGANCLIRQFDVQPSPNSDTETVTMIVDWKFIVPSGDIAGESLAAFKSGGKTIGDVHTALYTEPESGKLKKYWYSNITISNSLANFMYGTSGVQYVTSGYLVPSLTILKSSNVSSELVGALFKQNGFTLTNAGTKYCDTSQMWWDSYFKDVKGVNDSDLKALLQSIRQFAMYDGVVGDGCTIYGGKKKAFYLITDYNVVYANIDAMDMTFDNKTLRVSTQFAGDGSSTLQKGDVVDYAGKKWIYYDNSGEFLKLLPNFSVGDDSKGILSGVYSSWIVNYGNDKFVFPVSADTGKSLTNTASLTSPLASNTYKNFIEFTTDDLTVITSPLKKVINEKIYDKYFKGQVFPVDLNKPQELFGFTSSLSDFSGSYTYGGNYNVCMSDKAESIKPESLATKDKDGIEGGKITGAYPIIYLYNNNYYVRKLANGNCSLEEGYLMSSLNVAEVVTCGINRAVIDSMVASFSSTIKLEEVPSGAKIYVGDKLLTKVGSGNETTLVSTPIKDAAVAAKLKEASEQETVALIARLFLGTSINYSSGIADFTSYLTEETTVGVLNGETDEQNVLCKKNNKLAIKTSDGYSTDLTGIVDSVCVSLKLQKGLLAQPMSADKTTYRLLTVSSVNGNNFVNDLPFFTESLSYNLGKDSDLMFGNAIGTTHQFFSECKDNFNGMMEEAFAGDLKNVILMLLFFLTNYLCISSWILFAILHYNVGKPFLELFCIPSSSGHSAGFDIIKIISLGIYDINSDPTFGRTLVLSFVCFFIDYAILFLQL